MSIRARLTIWYVALLAIVLIVFSAVFYGILNFSLNTEVNRTLEDRANQVVTDIVVRNPPANIIQTGVIQLPELSVFSSSSIFIEVTDPDGEGIARSDNLGKYTLPVSESVIASVNAGNSVQTDVRVQGIGLRIFSQPIVFNQNVIGVVHVGQTLTEVETTLRRVSFALVGGTILALIIATLLGAMMAHISLRPIDRITMTANQIVSAEDLGQRLLVRGTNDELDRLSQTINGMLARLDNFFQAQVRLSADVSHELRTPLTIIRGNVDLLRQEREMSPEDRTETIFAIESAMDRMARLVSDLLLLSQADAGMSLTMRPVELELLILDVFHEAHALSKGVLLRVGHTEAANVLGDSDRLKQLLINLMHNAIKHTPGGGCVTISLYKKDDWAQVNVADTGSGIDPEDLPRIFDRFYRAKGQTRRGSGLGLAIAKWIAEAHRGTVVAESQPGNGSTFILRLPLLKEQQPSVIETRPAKTAFGLVRGQE
jgi:signal transduction histidine kinase